MIIIIHYYWCAPYVIVRSVGCNSHSTAYHALETKCGNFLFLLRISLFSLRRNRTTAVAKLLKVQQSSWSSAIILQYNTPLYFDSLGSCALLSSCSIHLHRCVGGSRPGHLRRGSFGLGLLPFLRRSPPPLACLDVLVYNHRHCLHSRCPRDGDVWRRRSTATFDGDIRHSDVRWRWHG